MCVLGPPYATCLLWRVPGYRNIPTTKHIVSQTIALNMTKIPLHQALLMPGHL